MNLSRNWLREFVTVDANDHDFAEAWETLDYVPIELCLQPFVHYEFCCATGKRRNFVPQWL